MKISEKATMFIEIQELFSAQKLFENFACFDFSENFLGIFP